MRSGCWQSRCTSSCSTMGGVGAGGLPRQGCVQSSAAAAPAAGSPSPASQTSRRRRGRPAGGTGGRLKPLQRLIAKVTSSPLPWALTCSKPVLSAWGSSCSSQWRLRVRKSASVAQDLRMPSVLSSRANGALPAVRRWRTLRCRQSCGASCKQRLAVDSPGAASAPSSLISCAMPSSLICTRSQSPTPATAHQPGVSTSRPRVQP